MLFRIMAVALTLAWLAASPAEACSCIQPGPPCSAYAQADAVFSGRVTDIRQRANSRDERYELWQRGVIFAVIEPFRGVKEETVEVLTGRGGGDCGYGFAPWKEYLVYANKDPKTGKLITSICTRTRPLGGAEEDLKYLRLRDRPEMAAGFHAIARRLKREDNNNTSFEGYESGLAVILDGPQGRRTATTNRDGQAEIWGLPPGEYTVSVGAPSGLIPFVMPPKITVPERGCASTMILLTPPPRPGGKGNRR